METLKNQLCQGLPHFCSGGVNSQKSDPKPEIKAAQREVPSKTNDKQKPWSVFGDVYWI